MPLVFAAHWTRVLCLGTGFGCGRWRLLGRSEPALMLNPNEDAPTGQRARQSEFPADVTDVISHRVCRNAKAPRAI